MGILGDGGRSVLPGLEVVVVVAAVHWSDYWSNYCFPLFV